MSSVVGYEKCPRCGGIFHYEFDCRSNEEWWFCNSCGRREGWHYERDKEGKIIYDENGNPRVEKDELAGYGTIHFSFEKFAVSYSIEKDVDIDEIKRTFLKDLENDEIIKEKCYLTIWDEEAQALKSEYGKIPETYDEFEERCKLKEGEEETS